MRLVPVSRREAQAFIARYHRHNRPSMVDRFRVGVADDDGLVGVAQAGLPVARRLCDGTTLEVTRTCVKPDARNANSMLYGACARAAAALGYRRLITYTLPDESGASLRGAGWQLDTDRAGYGPNTGTAWQAHQYKSGLLFPDDRRIPDGFKRRWVRVL